MLANMVDLSSPAAAPVFACTSRGGVIWIAGFSGELLYAVAITPKYLPESAYEERLAGSKVLWAPEIGYNSDDIAVAQEYRSVLEVF